MKRKVILVLSLAIAAVYANAAYGQSAIDQLRATRPAKSYGQDIPQPGSPQMVAIPCVNCGKWIDTPGGKIPAVCPRCGQSPVSQTQRSPGQTMPTHTYVTPKRPQLQTINPFGDYLFYGVPIVPDDGKLETRHLDPDGLAARAEEWGKEMRQVNEQSHQKQEAQTQEFERRKHELFKNLDASRATGSAGLKLTNVFADDPNVVDLRGATKLVPRMLNDGDPELSLTVKPPPMPGDDLRPKGTSFFGLGGGAGSEPMSLAEAQFREIEEMRRRTEDSERWRLPGLLCDAAGLIGEGQWRDVKTPRYGKWYGEGWSGGPDGHMRPEDALDAIAMRHDFAYDAAVMQGKTYGPMEELRLKAIADAMAVKAAGELDPDPTQWKPPPGASDPKSAAMHRDGMIFMFKGLGLEKAVESKVTPVFWSYQLVSSRGSDTKVLDYYVDHYYDDTRNRYTEKDLALAAASLENIWEMKQKKWEIQKKEWDEKYNRGSGK